MVPKILKMEEGFCEKATCTIVQPLPSAQVTQVWSQSDSIQVELEHETTHCLQLEFLPKLKYSSRHSRHEEEKVIFKEVK